MRCLPLRQHCIPCHGASSLFPRKHIVAHNVRWEQHFSVFHAQLQLNTNSYKEPVPKWAIQRRENPQSRTVVAQSQTVQVLSAGDQVTLEAPLLKEMLALNGRIRRTSLARFRPERPKSLSHPSSYYDLTSTRPPSLDLPDPVSFDKEASPSVTERSKVLVKTLYKTAKGYLIFYKNGLKAVWSNYKEYREIAPRARAFDQIHSTTPRTEIIPKMKAAFEAGQITRREYLLYLRTRRDLRKLVPFLVIFCIFGEFSPLILLPLGPRVIPFPCLIPKQVIQQYQAEKAADRVNLAIVERGTERPMPTIPSRQTWKSFDQQLRHIDGTTTLTTNMERQRCIGKDWYHPKSSTTERPLADALLILWEGGVQTLDDREVLLKTWSSHDLHLSWTWKDAYLSSRGRSIEKDDFTKLDHADGWVNSQKVDMSSLRTELQLSLEDLVARLDFYFKTGLDYDQSKPVEARKRAMDLLQPTKR